MDPGNSTFKLEKLVWLKKLPLGWISAGCVTVNLAISEVVRLGWGVTEPSQAVSIIRRSLIAAVIASIILFSIGVTASNILKGRIQPEETL